VDAQSYYIKGNKLKCSGYRIQGINVDSVSNVAHEASGHFRNKRRANLKDKINYLTTDTENKNIRELCRGINEFSK
jgi:hypothetical protein